MTEQNQPSLGSSLKPMVGEWTIPGSKENLMNHIYMLKACQHRVDVAHCVHPNPEPMTLISHFISPPSLLTRELTFALTLFLIPLLAM